MIRTVTLCLFVALVGCAKSPTAEPESKSAAREEAQAGSKDAAVAAISPQAAQTSGIEVLTASPAVIRETLTLYGAIKPNAEREQTVRARYPGVVRSVSKRPGDRVARDETLLTIESNDSLEPYSVRSPMNGNVLERNVNPGETVDAATALIRIADLTTVWAEFAVFARDLGRVRGGMQIGIRSGETDVVGTTKLTYVASTGHTDSQSVVARAIMNNADGRWVAGQFVTGEVVVSDVRAPVAVAPSALQTLKQGTAVFVQTDKGFEPREVQIGHRDRDAIEIIKGVSAGEKYAAKNSYLIKADLLKSEVEEE